MCFSSLFKSPAAPPPPPPPVALPERSVESKSIMQAKGGNVSGIEASRRKRRQAAASAQRSTVLTGNLGQASTAQKTLLGQ